MDNSDDEDNEEPVEWEAHTELVWTSRGNVSTTGLDRQFSSLLRDCNTAIDSYVWLECAFPDTSVMHKASFIQRIFREMAEVNEEEALLNRMTSDVRWWQSVSRLVRFIVVLHYKG